MLRSIWYVTTRGSFFFRRIWCAAMPRPTRSSDSSISRACCFVSAKMFPYGVSASIVTKTFCELARMISLTGAQHAAPLQLRSLGFRRGPFERFRSGDQAVFCGIGEIQFQAAPIFRIEREINVVAQVRFERVGRQFHFLLRVEANFRD